MRPDDAGRVIIFFDHGGNKTAHSDPVTAHDHRLLLPLIIEKYRALGLTVLCSQLKDMSQFDRDLFLQFSLVALRAGLAFCMFVIGAAHGFTRRTLHDGILPDHRRHHKLMRNIPAHGTGIRLDDRHIQPAALKYFLVGPVHQLIISFQTGFIPVKAVSILHDKLAGPDNTETRADFVPEFSLDLIQHDRQLPIRMHMVLHQIRDHLFVRGAQTHFAAALIFKTDHDLFHRLIPAGLLPKFDRLQARQE